MWQANIKWDSWLDFETSPPINAAIKHIGKISEMVIQIIYEVILFSNIQPLWLYAGDCVCPLQLHVEVFSVRMFTI